MKTRRGWVLASILVLSLLVIVAAACGGGTQTPAKESTTTARLVVSLAGKADKLGSTDGVGPAARFNGPEGIACDAAGNVYVADNGNNTVRKVTRQGLVTTLAGKALAAGHADAKGAAARFNAPAGIACDAAGNLYVVDSKNDTVRKVTPTGVVITLAGKAGVKGSADGSGAAARFSDPQGVACDPAGNVYLTDTGNETIRKITPAGVVTTLAGTAAAQGSADGNAGAALFNNPIGIARDTAGNLYVTDTLNNAIRKITPAGAVTTLAGKAGSKGSADGNGAAASFQAPVGVACDAAGNLYVTDNLNDTIRLITPAGKVSTLAGAVGVAKTLDGSGTTARFDLPGGIACDSAGNLYVTGYAPVIRKILLKH